MASARTATRSLRALRTVPARPRTTGPVRRYATEANSSSGSGGLSAGVTGGIIGGSLVFLGAYSYYHFSGAKTMVNSLHQTKSYFDSVHTLSLNKLSFYRE